MAYNPAYNAKIKNPKPGQKENVRVYKVKSKEADYCDYDDPKIVYKKDDLSILNEIPDKEL